MTKRKWRRFRGRVIKKWPEAVNLRKVKYNRDIIKSIVYAFRKAGVVK